MTLASFATLDWLVLSGYLLLLLVSSWWISRRKQKDTTDYFLAGRRIPAWAAAFSVMATSLSAATFIGAPGITYAGDMTYLSSFLGIMLGAVVVAAIFIPAFYRQNVATVYQLLETRYGQLARRTASAMFMLGRVLASGARLYIGALAAAFLFFGATTPGLVSLAILAVVVVGVVYTFVGGIEAVVWADVVQSCVFIGAALFSIALLLYVIPADLPTILAALREPAVGEASKLTLISTSMDLSHPYTLAAALIGFTLLGIGSYGTDQDLTQRMLTCRDAKQGARSALSGVFMTIPMALLFLIVGLLLFIFYQRPDVMGEAFVAAGPDDDRSIYLDFIVHHIPAGVGGLMMAGLFAAALSSFNSELNAMSSTLINDFYRSLRPGRSEGHYLLMGRLGIIFWGVMLGGFAVICAYWQHAGDTALIDFALGIMTFAYSGLVAVFLTVLLTNRGSTGSVLAALAVGFFTVLAFNVEPWTWTAHGVEPIGLAFPWVLALATALAFGVCCLGNSPQPESGSASLADASQTHSNPPVPTPQVERP